MIKFIRIGEKKYSENIFHKIFFQQKFLTLLSGINFKRTKKASFNLKFNVLANEHSLNIVLGSHSGAIFKKKYPQTCGICYTLRFCEILWPKL